MLTPIGSKALQYAERSQNSVPIASQRRPNIPGGLELCRIFSVISATADARVMGTDNPFMRGFLIWLEVVRADCPVISQLVVWPASVRPGLPVAVGPLS